MALFPLCGSIQLLAPGRRRRWRGGRGSTGDEPWVRPPNRLGRNFYLTYLDLRPGVHCVTLMAEFAENSGRQAEEHDGTSSRNVPDPLCGTGDPAMTVPRGLWSSHHDQRKKLVLHIDLNNTILVSDAATGQGTVAALDYFLSTVTWGKMSKHGKLEMSTFQYHTRMLGMCARPVRWHGQLMVAVKEHTRLYWKICKFKAPLQLYVLTYKERPSVSQVKQM